MKEVSAAVIFDREGKILICRRSPGGSCGLLWEFPGGKCELGETAQECAVRECEEELGIRIQTGRILGEKVHTYPDGMVRVVFYEATVGETVPQCRVHEEICWVKPQELVNYEFCPADRELIAQLIRCPGRRKEL